MRVALAALVLAVSLLSGCAEEGRASLLSIYPGSDKTEDGQLILNGTILEARIGDGAWGLLPKHMIEVPEVVTPDMMTPMPQGGGASTIDIPLELNVTFEARLLQQDKLAGYFAYWALMPLDAMYSNSTQGPDALQVHEAPADGVLTATLPGPGVYLLIVALDPKSGLDVKGDDEPAAFGMSYAQISVGAHIPFKGEVQPVRPGTGGGAEVTPAAQMQDTYRFTVGSATPAKVVTRHNGGPTDILGGDVDVGFFDSSGNGAMCEGTAGTASGPAPDPSQSAETLEFVLTTPGTWSLVVGAMPDGCPNSPTSTGGSTWYYNNLQPVPYAGDLYLGFEA